MSPTLNWPIFNNTAYSTLLLNIITSIISDYTIAIASSYTLCRYSYSYSYAVKCTLKKSEAQLKGCRGQFPITFLCLPINIEGYNCMQLCIYLTIHLIHYTQLVTSRLGHHLAITDSTVLIYCFYLCRFPLSQFIDNNHFAKLIVYSNTGKTPCKYGPVFAPYLHDWTLYGINTVQNGSVFT